MKNKLFLLALFFATNVFFVESCFAGACSDDFWSKRCQNYIHKRDHKNNIKQTPRVKKIVLKRCVGGGLKHNLSKNNHCKVVLKYPNLVYDY